MRRDRPEWFPAVAGSWGTTVAVGALASVVGSMLTSTLTDSATLATVLLGGGIAAAAVGVAAHVVATWRSAHSL